MQELIVHILRAFTSDPQGGNLAGVVLDADALTPAQMQAIAREVGHSETAFVLPSDRAARRLRFFTPEGEVDLCGHATVATYHLLRARSLLGPGETTHELRAGVLGVALEPDGWITMQQPAPVFGDCLPLAQVASVLGIPPDWIESTGLPVQVVSTGMPDVMVPIDTREHLWRVAPDLQRMAAFNRQCDTVGFHLFTTDTCLPGSAAHCRNFAPAVGIAEEAATGSSCGALAGYLHRHGRGEVAFDFEQGYSMGSPSQLRARLSVHDGRIDAVAVSGRAVQVGERRLVLPDPG